MPVFCCAFNTGQDALDLLSAKRYVRESRLGDVGAGAAQPLGADADVLLRLLSHRRLPAPLLLQHPFILMGIESTCRADKLRDFSK